MGVEVFADVCSKASEEEFREVLKIATESIKVNNIGFNKRTKINEIKFLLDKILISIKEKGCLPTGIGQASKAKYTR